MFIMSRENGDFLKDRLGKSTHMCLIFDNDEQRKEIVSRYLAEGIQNNEQVRYLTDRTAPEIIQTWLQDAGVEHQKARDNGSFLIAKAENAYCQSGCFDPQQIINNLMHHYSVAREAGRKGNRTCAEMSWSLKNVPGADRLLEYEVILNNIETDFPHTGMCQYDARLFDGATLYNILQVHPYMIANGQVVQNPFYIRPDEFLAKLRSGK
jgi:hypothetical protein